MLLSGLLEGLFVHIAAAREKRLGTAAGMTGNALFVNHGIMGQGHGLAVAQPVIVKRNLFHKSFSFCKAS